MTNSKKFQIPDLIGIALFVLGFYLTTFVILPAIARYFESRQPAPSTNEQELSVDEKLKIHKQALVLMADCISQIDEWRINHSQDEIIQVEILADLWYEQFGKAGNEETTFDIYVMFRPMFDRMMADAPEKTIDQVVQEWLNSKGE